MVKIRLVGVQKLKAAILDNIGEAYVTIVDDQFETEGQQWGKKWVKLKETIQEGGREVSARRKRIRPREKKRLVKAKILTDTTKMRRNTSPEVRGNKVIITNNSPQARAQNFGYKPNNLVAREFFVLNKKVIQSLKKEIEFVIKRMAGR